MLNPRRNSTTFVVVLVLFLVLFDLSLQTGTQVLAKEAKEVKDDCEKCGPTRVSIIELLSTSKNFIEL